MYIKPAYNFRTQHMVNPLRARCEASRSFTMGSLVVT